MKNNQQGGILSKIIFIPAGVALMVGFFFLGYYVGKYQSKSRMSGEIAAPLPEIASATGQKPEEFTFYKTLTDRNDKTVSIDLKPRSVKEGVKTEKQQTDAEARRSTSVAPAPKEKRQAASQQLQSPAKRGSAAAAASANLRYSVQTASYQDRAMAEDEMRRLKKRGFAAFIVSSEMPGKGVLHRVRIGSFSNKAGAEKLQRTVHEKERILTIVVSE